MRLVLSFLITFFTLGSGAQTFADIRMQCTPFIEGDRPLTRSAEILNSKAELVERFEKKYRGQERLLARAYFDFTREEFLLPIRGEALPVDARFFSILSSHISKSIQNRYADAVFYPDLGHMHLLLPDEEWKRIKSVHSGAHAVKAALESKELRGLFHTVEMVQIKEGDFAKGKMPQDQWKLWRYYSRNLLGTFGASPKLEVIFAGEKEIYNTVRSIPGFTAVTTLYISANESACFEYQSESTQKFYDVTFDPIPYEQNFVQGNLGSSNFSFFDPSFANRRLRFRGESDSRRDARCDLH